MARRAEALVLALAVLVAATTAHAAPAKKKAPAAPPSRFSVEHAISLVSFGEMEWSPRGDKLAFVVATPDTAESTTNYDLYLADIDRHAVQRLTRNPKGDSSPTFSPSGDTIAFASTRGSDDKPTIYMMSLEGGEPWAFGSFDEAVGEVHWSPDGRYLAYTKNDTLPRAVVEQRRKKWDPTVEGERFQYPQLWVADLVTGTRRRLVAGSFVVWNARWSPDSRMLAYLTNPTWAADDANLTDIGVVSVAGGAPRTLGAGTERSVVGGDFQWSPDSKWIAWSSNRHRDVFIEKDELWVCAATGGAAPAALTPDFEESTGVPAWNASSDTLSFHVAMGLTTLVGVVPRAGGPIRLTSDRHGSAGTMIAARTGRVAWVESHATVPDEIVVADHPELPGTPVTSLNAGVAALDLGPSRSVRWHDADQNWVEGVLLRPPGETLEARAATDGAKNSKRYKTLVLLHGGPYGLRSDLGFNAWAQYFAAAGYQVFMPNYRGSGGYGTAFMVRQRHDWGGQDWDDVMRGVDEMVRSWGADPDRLGILGASYGGYLTVWGVTQTDRFKAAHIDRGISDLPGLWGQSDTHQYRTYDFGGRPWEVPDRWRERSPMTHIGDVKTPMLIVVGDNDARTPIAQSRELYTALSSLGVPVQLVHYPREGHGLREPRHRADALLRARAWFDRWIP